MEDCKCLISGVENDGLHKKKDHDPLFGQSFNGQCGPAAKEFALPWSSFTSTSTIVLAVLAFLFFWKNKNTCDESPKTVTKSKSELLFQEEDPTETSFDSNSVEINLSYFFQAIEFTETYRHNSEKEEGRLLQKQWLINETWLAYSRKIKKVFCAFCV